MKTRFVIIFLFIFGKMSASVTETQAKEILKSHFISQEEARIVYPDLPNLSINFSESFLKKNSDAWLIPVRLYPKKFSYLLVRSNFEYEVCSFKKIDTLNLETAKEVLSLFDKLRPSFPEKPGTKKPFKYFFRTKDYSFSSGINVYHKIIACDKGQLAIIDWPNGVELGVVNDNSVSYLIKNKKNETEIGYKSFPKRINVKNQTIFILTLINHKNE